MISGIQYKNEYIGVNIGQAYDLSNLEHTMQAILVELKPQFPCFNEMACCNTHYCLLQTHIVRKAYN
jgi:hypothetical protein